MRDTEVALKILYSQFQNSEAAWEVFQREFTLTARLNHPGVLRVYEPVRTAEATVLPMVFAAGGDLRQMRGAPYTKILPLLIDIAAALEHAHTRRIVHRDLKPSNILLDVGRTAAARGFRRRRIRRRQFQRPAGLAVLGESPAARGRTRAAHRRHLRSRRARLRTAVRLSAVLSRIRREEDRHRAGAATEAGQADSAAPRTAGVMVVSQAGPRASAVHAARGR